MSRPTDYDSLAAGYDVRYRNYDYGEIEAALLEFLGDAALGRLLEVGCGTGHWLRTLGGRARFVAGVDRSGEMLARAKAAGSVVVRAIAEALPWPDASFDRIVCVNAVHHFDDRDRFYAECRRVVSPGGGLFVVGLDPHADRDTWWVYDYFPETRAIDLRRYPAVREIRGGLVKAGFSWSESREVQVFEDSMPAAVAFERGLVSGSFTSQLAVLTDEEFQAGVARIREGMKSVQESGGELSLASELHLYATVGWTI